METFPGVEIKGGVSYFLWTRDSEGDCEFTTVVGGEIQSQSVRDLRDGKGVVIRDNLASSIIDKVLHSHNGAFLSTKVSPQTPFGIYTNFSDWHSKKREGDVQLFKRGLEEAWTSKKNILTRVEWIPKIKVIMSYAYNGGDALPHQVIGRPIVIQGNSAVTQTYMVAGVFDNNEEAENYAEYLKTRFVRFLIRQRKISQHNRPDTFSFVPDLPMNTKWTDDVLYKKFGITSEEQDYISSIVKLMPKTVGNEEEDDV
jgi:site-specific DNA-methyltransferase (adenine-specific)